MASATTIPSAVPERPPLKFPRRRVRTPTVLQMEAAECGAAALSIMLGYFETFVRGGARPRLLQSLSTRLAGSRLGLMFVVLITLALVLPNLVIPVFSRVYIDAVLVDNRLMWVKPLLLAIALTAAVKAVITFL